MRKDFSRNFVSDDLSLRNMFASDFVTKFSHQFIIKVRLGPTESCSFQLSIDAVSVIGVLELLPGSAAGLDYIPSIFCKHLANVLAQLLSVIFNQSVMKSCIPAS